MIVVELKTEQGEHVAKVIIPPFKFMPEVIMWGSRLFLRHKPPMNYPNRIQYRECFAVAIVPGMDDCNLAGKELIKNIESGNK